MLTHPRRLTRSVFFSPLPSLHAGRTTAANHPARLQRVGQNPNNSTKPSEEQEPENEPTPKTVTSAAVDPPETEDEPQEAQFDDEETESVEEQIEQNRDAGVVTNPPFRRQDEE